MRHLLFLAVGLGIGIAGTILFRQSSPPEPGSMEERAVKAERALAKAEKKITAFEAVVGPQSGGFLTETFSDRGRKIAEDFEAGRPVSPDDLFHAIKPMMRTLAPVFEAIRFREQKELFDTMAGEFSREYDLDPAQQEALANFLAAEADKNAREYFEVMTSDSTRFIDFVKASEEFERFDEIDAFMERTLSGEKLEEYQTNRLNEKLSRVQNEADRNVQRLDTIVSLDENQKDRLFEYMARSSRDFDPAMNFEGLAGADGSLNSGQPRSEAIMEVLRPEQRSQFDAYRREQRDAAVKELGEIGLTLPDDWDMFDEWD